MIHLNKKVCVLSSMNKVFIKQYFIVYVDELIQRTNNRNILSIDQKTKNKYKKHLCSHEERRLKKSKILAWVWSL